MGCDILNEDEKKAAPPVSTPTAISTNKPEQTKTYKKDEFNIIVKKTDDAKNTITSAITANFTPAVAMNTKSNSKIITRKLGETQKLSSTLYSRAGNVGMVFSTSPQKTNHKTIVSVDGSGLDVNPKNNNFTFTNSSNSDIDYSVETMSEEAGTINLSVSAFSENGDNTISKSVNKAFNIIVIDKEREKIDIIVEQHKWDNSKGSYQLDITFLKNDNIQQYKLVIKDPSTNVIFNGTVFPSIKKTIEVKTAGVYTAKYYGWDNNGEQSEVKEEPFTVANMAPTIVVNNFKKDLTVGESFEIDLSLSKDNDGTIQQILVDYGDNTAIAKKTDKTQKFTYAYTDTGRYTLNIKLKDNLGLFTDSSYQIKVSNNAPVARMNTFAPVYQLGEIAFDFTNCSDPDGHSIVRKVDFGDGTIVDSVASTTTHTYTKIGSFKVKLKVTDQYGLSTEITQQINIENKSPVARMNDITKQTYYTGMAVNFDFSQSSDPDGKIINYYINFGDGTTKDNGTTKTVQHTYNFNDVDLAQKVYPVALTVTDDKGAKNTITKNITIKKKQVINAKYIVKDNNNNNINTDNYKGKINAGSIVKFDGTSSTPGQDATITSYKWSITWKGNKYIVASGPNKAIYTHTVNWIGNGIVELEIQDSKGGVSSINSYSVKSENRPPVAVLGVNKTTGYVPLDVIYTYKDSYDPDQNYTGLDDKQLDQLMSKMYSTNHSYWQPGNWTNNTEFKFKWTVPGKTPLYLRLWDKYNGETYDTVYVDVLDVAGDFALFDGSTGVSDTTSFVNNDMVRLGDNVRIQPTSSQANSITSIVYYLSKMNPATRGVSLTMSYISDNSSKINKIVTMDKDETRETGSHIKLFNSNKDLLGYLFKTDSLAASSNSVSYTGQASIIGVFYSKAGTHFIRERALKINPVNKAPKASLLVKKGASAISTGSTINFNSANENISLVLDASGSTDDAGLSNMRFNYQVSKNGGAYSTIGSITNANTKDYLITKPGNYKFKVVVSDTDKRGHLNTTSSVVEIKVNNPAPVANFTIKYGTTNVTDGNVVIGANGLTISLKASSNESGVTYNWSGDVSASGALTSKTLTQLRTYSFTLTVTDKFGVSTKVTHAVTATAPAPVANFTIKYGNKDVTDGYIIKTGSIMLQLKSTSTGIGLRYSWSVGGGTASKEYSYTTLGRKTITLTVEDMFNRSSSVSKYIDRYAEIDWEYDLVDKYANITYDSHDRWVGIKNIRLKNGIPASITSVIYEVTYIKYGYDGYYIGGGEHSGSWNATSKHIWRGTNSTSGYGDGETRSTHIAGYNDGNSNWRAHSIDPATTSLGMFIHTHTDHDHNPGVMYDVDLIYRVKITINTNSGKPYYKILEIGGEGGRTPLNRIISEGYNK